MALAPIERALRFYLLDQSQYSQTVTYARVAQALSPYSPVRLEKPFSPLHSWLAEVSRFEATAGRPLLSAIVVTHDTQRPGEGFFAFARELGFQFADESQFWHQQLSAVFRTWPSSRTSLVTTHKVLLADGREVRVREYAGGPLRVLVDDPPYVISEAFLTRGKSDRAILRLEPRWTWAGEMAASGGPEQ